MIGAGSYEPNAAYWAAKKITHPRFEYLGYITTSGETARFAAAQLEDMKLFDWGGAYVYATITRDPGPGPYPAGSFEIDLYRCLRANLPLGPWEIVSDTSLAYTGSQGTINDMWVAAGNIIRMPDGSTRLYRYGAGTATSKCSMLVSIAPIGTAIEDLPSALVPYAGNPILVDPAGEWLNDALIWTPEDTGAGWRALYINGVHGDGYYGVWADSVDGLAWTIPTGAHALDIGADGEWDSKCVLPIGQKIYRNGRWEFPYQAASGNRFSVGWAWTYDIETIHKDPDNPVLVAGVDGTVCRENPGVLVIDGKVHLFSVDANSWGGDLLSGGQGSYTKIHVSREI